MRSIPYDSGIYAQDDIHIFHTFEFELRNLDGSLAETLRLTDLEAFFEWDKKDYTPVSITFSEVKETFTLQSETVNVDIDNIGNALSDKAFQYEWRLNKAKIQRFFATSDCFPNSVDGVNYDYGVMPRPIGTNDIYMYDIQSSDHYDVYTVFLGYIDSFTATDERISATLKTGVTNLGKQIPERSYDQSIYTKLIDAMTTELKWGSQ